MLTESAGKQAVSNPAAELPDDDDIVDLLEVVKPGKTIAGQTGDAAADFEAMLHKLSDDVEGGGEAPFPDPNPVDYTVDHNEELELPDMADVDALLETLGESAGGTSAKDRAQDPLAGGDAQAAKAEDVSVEDLDAMPLGGRHDLPESVTIDDDFLADLGGEADAPAPDKAAGSAPDLDLDIDALLGEAPAAPEKPASKKIPPSLQPKAAPDKKPQAPAAESKSGASRDEVDLNELDALLDDVLAGAPSTSEAPDQPEEDDALLDAALAAPDSDVTARQQDIDTLRGDMQRLEAGLRDAIAANRKGVENDLAATLGRAATAETISTELKGLVAKQGGSLQSQGSKLEELATALTGASARLDRLEQAQAALEALNKSQKTLGERLKKLEQAQSVLDEGKTALEALTKDHQAAVARLNTLEQSQTAPDEGKAALEALDKALTAAGERLDKLEEAQAALGADKAALEALDKDHKADETRLDALEQEEARLAARLQEAEQSFVGQTEAVKALEKALADQTAALDALRQAQAEGIARLDKLEHSGQDETLKELTGSLPLFQSRLDGVEQSLAEQIGRLKKVESAANAHLARSGETDAQLSDCLKTVREMAQNQSLFSDRLGALEQKLAAAPSLERLEALERKFADLESGMEKAAAAAAAKVIREEIGALLGA
jgi:predicted  nucleic acid-binding Zn-ribbon protein